MKSGEQVISVSEVTKRRYEPCKLGTMPIYLQDETNVNEKKETVMKIICLLRRIHYTNSHIQNNLVVVKSQQIMT